MWETLKTIALAITGLKTIIQMVSQALDWFSRERLKRQAEERDQAIDDAAKEIGKANEVEDESARLKAKAEAACKLEKVMDPSSDCDASGPH